MLQSELTHENLVKNSAVHVQSEGISLWHKAYTKISCNMEFALYPFDMQRCVLRMGSTARNITDEHYYLNQFSYKPEKASTPFYIVDFTKLEKDIYTGFLDRMNYSTTGFILNAHRKLQAFIMNVYIPSGVLVIISFIGFLSFLLFFFLLFFFLDFYINIYPERKRKNIQYFNPSSIFL